MKQEFLQPAATITAALIAVKPSHQEVAQVAQLFAEVYQQLVNFEKLLPVKPGMKISPEALKS